MKIDKRVLIAVRILALAAFVYARFAKAQVNGMLPPPDTPGNMISMQYPVGLPPGSGKEGTSETVNLANGALTMFLPVLSLPQRAGSSPLVVGFTYDSNQTVLQQNLSALPAFIDPGSGQVLGSQCVVADGCTMFDDFTYNITTASPNLSPSPLQLNLPRLSASLEWEGDVEINGQANNGTPLVVYAGSQFCLTNFVFYDWSGTAHTFQAAPSGIALGVLSNCMDHFPSVDSMVYPPYLVKQGDSYDNEFYRLDTSSGSDFTVTAPDGTVFHFANPQVPCECGAPNGGSSLEQYLYEAATSIVDRNGNKTTISAGALASDSATIVDTLGRTIHISSDWNSGNQTIAYQDANGTSQRVSLTLGPNFESIPNVSGADVGNVVTNSTCSVAVNNPLIQGQYQYTLNLETQSPPPAGSGGPTGVGYIPYTLSFSESQKTFHMLFDSFGHLMKIRYPSGGYHRYDYSFANEGISNQGPIRCSWPSIQVAHRYECRDSSGSCSQEDTTGYGMGDSLITYPDGSSSNYTFGAVYAAGLSAGTPLITDLVEHSPSGTVMRTTHNDYASMNLSGAPTVAYVSNPFPTRVTTTYNDTLGSPSSYIAYSYDQVASSTQYFNQPANLVAPDIDLHTQNPIAIDVYGFDGTHLLSTAEAWFHSATGNILNRLSSKTVSDPLRAASATISYGLDARGNLQSVTTTGTNSTTQSTNYIPQGLSLDAYGRPQAAQDGLGNPATSYSYSDSWQDATCAPSLDSHAYLTSVTNAKSQTITYKYDSCTGNLASSKDANSRTTSYSYDGLGRLISTSYPDGGSVQSAYVDTWPNSVQTTKSQSPNPNVVSKTILDGLSRASQTQLLSDPSGVDYSDTTYDTMGRTATISNEYRSTNDGTYGVTLYFYDALGRKTEQVQADSTSTLWWCYDNFADELHPQPKDLCQGNGSSLTLAQWVDSLDESANHAQHVSDALGRLRSVIEPNGVKTDYGYDGFGNLWSAKQYGTVGESSRTRSFIYNGLSQLVSSANPENGTICYGTWNAGQCVNGYDADGNLQFKTDARGVTASYAYDSLNRLVSTVYSNDIAATPSSCYLYDGLPSLNQAGRLVQEWTQAYNSNCPYSPPTSGASMLTSTSITAYDALGRVLTSSQCVWTMCFSGGSSFQLVREYDFGGNRTQLVESGLANAVPQLRLTSNYDGAGRLSSMQSSWDGTPKSTAPLDIFSVQSYSPVGLQNWTVGNYLTFQKTYDTRERPTSQVVTHP